MKLLANENFPLTSVRYLKERGFDIRSIGIDNPSVADSAVINLSIKEGRTIVTFDRDYGELIFKHNHRPKQGVIYLRLEIYSPIEPGQIVEDLLKNEELIFENALTVVDNRGVRQRKY